MTATLSDTGSRSPTSTRATRSCACPRSSTRGSMELITDVDDCGVIATGRHHARPAGRRVLHRPHRAGRRDGHPGLPGDRRGLPPRARRRRPRSWAWHSGGARLREGVESLQAVGEVFAIMTRVSGRIPQISGARPRRRRCGVRPGADRRRRPRPRGPRVRHRSRRRPLGDRRGRRHAAPRRSRATRPPQRRRARRRHQRASRARTAGRSPGVAARRPRHARHRRRRRRPRRAAAENPKRGDVHPVVAGILDEGTALELHPRWAPNVVTTLGRLGGRAVGVIANNPLRLGGCLDATSAEKAARFVRMCDAFGLPLVVVVDVPGYLPAWARSGTASCAAARSCCTPSPRRPCCPRVTVVTARRSAAPTSP